MEFRTENSDGIATITFCQPDKMNPLSVDGFIGLAQAINSASDDATVEAIVLSGEGRAFCVGLDLPSFMAGAARDPEGGYSRDYLETVFDEGATAVALALSNSCKPTIAALNGVVAGAGIGVALGCDVVLAHEAVAFNLPFVPALGLSPDCGSTWILSRAMGRGQALPAMLLGEPISAEAALASGLIWKIVDAEELQTEAAKIAKRLGAGPIQTYPAIRDAVDRATTQDMAQQLDHEKALNVRLMNTPEFTEGVTAFREKRRPDFRALRTAKEQN